MLKGKTDQECADYAIAEIEKLSETVGIPKKLTELGIQEKTLTLTSPSKNALIDACARQSIYANFRRNHCSLYKELLKTK